MAFCSRGATGRRIRFKPGGVRVRISPGALNAEAIGNATESPSFPTAYAAVPQQEDGTGSDPVN